MIPKLLHRALKDLKSLHKNVASLSEGVSDESLHDESDRLDVEFESFPPEQVNEAMEFYGMKTEYGKPKEVFSFGKNAEQWLKEELSF